MLLLGTIHRPVLLQQSSSSWLSQHWAAQVLLLVKKVIAVPYQEGLLKCWGQVLNSSLCQICNVVPHPLFHNDAEITGTALTELGLKTHQSLVLCVTFFWSGCVDTHGRKKKLNNVIHKKSLLEVNLRYMCTFYYGISQSLYIAITIMWPAQRNLKRASFGVWWCFLGGLGLVCLFGVFFVQLFWVFSRCLSYNWPYKQRKISQKWLHGSCSPQEKAYLVPFNRKFWTELVLKYWVNFPLQCLAVQL